MKKLLAILFAATVVPTFHAHAWVGGPFDNNNFGPEGDDGIYEAVATAPNALGLYRWGVGNRATAVDFNDNRTGNTSNVQFGAFVGSSNQHTWFYQGQVYYGTCFGTVNSAIGSVSCVGAASNAVSQTITTGNLAVPGIDANAATDVDATVNSFFQAQSRGGKYSYVAKDFSGSGIFQLSTEGVNVDFLVFGNRVSYLRNG